MVPISARVALGGASLMTPLVTTIIRSASSMHFVEIGGVEEHGGSRGCSRAEPGMHVPCRTDIEPTRGILGNDHGRRSKQLTSDDELLLVPTAQCTRTRARTGRYDVQIMEKLPCGTLRFSPVHPSVPYPRRILAQPEHHILGEAEG